MDILAVLEDYGNAEYVLGRAFKANEVADDEYNTLNDLAKMYKGLLVNYLKNSNCEVISRGIQAGVSKSYENL